MFILLLTWVLHLAPTSVALQGTTIKPKFKLVASTPWFADLQTPPLMLTGVARSSGLVYRIAPTLSQDNQGRPWLIRGHHAGPIQGNAWRSMSTKAALIDRVHALVPAWGGMVVLGTAGEQTVLAALADDGSLRWRHTGTVSAPFDVAQLSGEIRWLRRDAVGRVWLLGTDAHANHSHRLAEVLRSGHIVPVAATPVNHDVWVGWESVFDVVLKGNQRHWTRTAVSNGSTTTVAANSSQYEAFGTLRAVLPNRVGIFDNEAWYLVAPDGRTLGVFPWAGIVRDGLDIVVAQREGPHLDVERWRDGQSLGIQRLGPFQEATRLIHADNTGFVVYQMRSDTLLAFSPKGAAQPLPKDASRSALECRVHTARPVVTPSGEIWWAGTDLKGIFIVSLQGLSEGI